MDLGTAVVDFADPDIGSASFVAALRDAATEQQRVRWSGSVKPAAKVHLLHHLRPPVDDGSGHAESIAHWRDLHRPGLCYYRVGPGFRLVQDIRRPELPARFTISDPDTITVFESCLRPRAMADLQPGEQAIVDELVAEKLLARFGAYLVTLPHRMKRWPIPAPDV